MSEERRLTRNSLDDIAPNNSNRIKERSTTIKPNQKPKKEEEKRKPIAKNASVAKKTFWSKTKEAFLGEGWNIGNVGDFVLYDILGPALRNTIADMGFGFIENILPGARGRSGWSDSRYLRDRGRSFVAYNRLARDDDRGRDIDRRDRARHNFNNLDGFSQAEAREILFEMVECIEKYGEVTIGAFYEWAGISPDSVDYNYGWTNLRDAYVERSRNGYSIRLPQPRPL